MTTQTLLIIGILIAVALVIFYVIKYLKNKTYEGEIIEKVEDMHDGGEEYSSFTYYLVIRTPDNKKKRIYMDAKRFNEFKKGDYIKKEKGKLFPVKIDKKQ
jgi:hypothetical protein